MGDAGSQGCLQHEEDGLQDQSKAGDEISTAGDEKLPEGG